MNFLAGNNVSLSLDLLDEDGNNITANSIAYKVSDERGNVIVPTAPLTSFVVGDATITIIVTALQNTLPVTTDITSLRGLRFVEIYITTSTGLVKKELDYVIESDNVLATGINSFQTYPAAIFVAGTIEDIQAFSLASKSEKIIALIRARQMIGRLSFRYSFDNYEQLNRSYYSREITLATVAQYEAFPKDFKEALARAQVIQANDLLGGDEVDELRKDGIIAHQVGESKQTFAQNSRLETIVSRRTMKELSKFINYSVRASR